jgi:copper oxidase (laccase) domain-containing protein
MHSDINLGPVRVVFGGVDFGNMVLKFGKHDEVLSRHQRLMDMFPDKLIADMRTKGTDGLVDTKDIHLEEKWNGINCDCLITEDPKVCLALFPSDCIPLIIYSVTTDLKAIVHCGHRGIKLGLIGKTLDYILNKKGSALTDLRFYIGPSINKESYFFPEIFEEQKNSLRWKPYIEFRDDNYHIDLKGFTVSELLEFGVNKNSIIDSGINSFDKQYFSHRRSVLTGEPEGRNLVLVTSN